MLAEYAPGQRLVFARNPRYFRKDADGDALPYLDRVVVEIVPDQNAELLRLEAGQLDMTTTEIAPEDYAPLKRAADAGRVKLLDLGVGFDADALWFNLKPGAFAGDPRAAWLQRDELRRAISLAVDRKLFADTVFLGAGVPVYGPITPANKKWYSAEPAADAARSRARAKSCSRRSASTDRNGDGLLEDAAQPAGALHAAHAERATDARARRGGDPRRAEEDRPHRRRRGARRQRADRTFPVAAKYDAVYFRVDTTDTDPAHQPRFLAQLAAARTSGTSSRRRRPPTGSGRSTS